MSSITITNSLFLKGQSSFAIFTEIVGGVRSQSGLNYAAAEVLELAWRAWLSREIEACNSASAFVLGLDVSPRLRTIAKYYKSISEPEQVADPEANRTALIRTADECGVEYLPRIILRVGTTYRREKKYSEALRYYIEAGKAARGRDILSQAQSILNIAMAEADCGNSAGALRRFESVSSTVRALDHWYPALYAKYLNNVATVLAESGRIEESRQVIKVVLASPFAPRFPEWRETAREIEEATRSEPHASAPTVKTAVATLPVRHEEPRLRIKRQLSIPFICIVRFDLISPQIPLRGWGRYVVSQLDRYVKTVRSGTLAAVARLRRRTCHKCIVFGAIAFCVGPRGPPEVKCCAGLARQGRSPQISGRVVSSSIGARGPPPPWCGGVVWVNGSFNACASRRVKSSRTGYVHPRHPPRVCDRRVGDLHDRCKLACPNLPGSPSSSAAQPARRSARRLSPPTSRKRSRHRRHSADEPKWQADGRGRGKLHPSASAERTPALGQNVRPCRTL